MKIYRKPNRPRILKNKYQTGQKLLLWFLAFLLCHNVFGQFEQKVSLNAAVGIFKTFGPKTYIPDWASGPEDKEPHLMPQFEAGWAVNGGVQFNLNRHFSLLADIGFMYSGYWYYDPSDPNDPEDDYNYLYWEIYEDTIDYVVVATGENELSMFNLNIGLTPKYYFLPGKKFNPFVFAGIHINYTNVDYKDSQYEAYKDLGRLEEYGESESGSWMEKSFGLGIYPGAGLEYNLNDNLGFFLHAGYYLVFLNKGEFQYPEEEENLQALKVQVGVRFSFWKSKEL
jgi:opacity protein-like surface antigen